MCREAGVFMEGMKANLRVFRSDEAVYEQLRNSCAVGSDRSACDTRLQLRGQRTRVWTEAAAVIARSPNPLQEQLCRCLGCQARCYCVMCHFEPASALLLMGSSGAKPSLCDSAREMTPLPLGWAS